MREQRRREQAIELTIERLEDRQEVLRELGAGIGRPIELMNRRADGVRTDLVEMTAAFRRVRSTLDEQFDALKADVENIADRLTSLDLVTTRYQRRLTGLGSAIDQHAQGIVNRVRGSVALVTAILLLAFVIGLFKQI